MLPAAAAPRQLQIRTEGRALANSSELTFKVVAEKNLPCASPTDMRPTFIVPRAGQISSPRDAHAHLLNLISRPKRGQA